ncbi:hypothetical protein [Streptomyces olivochromogenes]|uniref:hypothetical protein n=1 Tax=Streptomyces olivochromogenes TaxID=1963 RepID=UPI001F4691C3|nr:hypothetical protein [Streptomyces olivochromogenes]MCF3130141.1 hypothetical protein [Streptomyces olivochromogenes]
MRTPVYELHIQPMFRATDRDHMIPFGLNLWEYDAVVEHAQHVLERLEAGTMPTRALGGPWPQEWIDLFRRWKEGGFKRLELGKAQFAVTRSPSAVTVKATGTYPAAGFLGWLQLESESDTAKTYVLYFEAPDAPVAGEADEFEFKERYSSSDTRTLFIHDSTGVQEH